MGPRTSSDDERDGAQRVPLYTHYPSYSSFCCRGRAVSGPGWTGALLAVLATLCPEVLFVVVMYARKTISCPGAPLPRTRTQPVRAFFFFLPLTAPCMRACMWIAMPQLPRTRV